MPELKMPWRIEQQHVRDFIRDVLVHDRGTQIATEWESQIWAYVQHLEAQIEDLKQQIASNEKKKK